MTVASPLEIIERFASFVEYDKERVSYVVGSRTHNMALALERLPLVQEYDPTGALSLLYVKNEFRRELEGTSVSLFDAACNQESFDADREMWAMLDGEVAAGIERELASRAERIVEEAVGARLLGDDAEVASKMAACIDDVVEGLGKCHEHVWLSDGAPLPRIQKFAGKVRVFDSMAQCVDTLAAEPPSVSLAYVRQERSADGFFGFFAHSGGTLVSIDDAILEAYPGQHGNMRNGRYLEGKGFALFPYSDMVEMSNPDYKGYYADYEVGGDIPLLELSEGSYLPLALAFSCVASKLAGRSFDGADRLHIVSPRPSGAGGSLPGPERAAGGAIAASRAEIARAEEVSAFVDVDADDVRAGRALDGGAASFMREGWISDYSEQNALRDAAVELYGAGFELDRAGVADFGAAEFIGTARAIREVALRRGRMQLARHMLAGMEREVGALGGKEGVDSWFAEMCRKHRGRIVELCVDRYLADQRRGELTYASTVAYGHNEGEPEDMRAVKRLKGVLVDWRTHPTLSPVEHYGGDAGRGARNLLSADGHRCRLLFCFQPLDYADLAAVFGQEDVPDVLRLWKMLPSHGMFGYCGNHILELTDPVCELHHPLSGYSFGCDENGLQERAPGNWFEPLAQIGFSVREMKAMVREREERR